ncbi:hypothetical protein K3495_g3171 [Podosphaera aphanis]|nr:hypothetical protein K3495_g3171 [Podosphaera aphanis]
MPSLQSWPTPSRKNWELVIKIFQLFPLVTTFQWLGVSYPAGKTSIISRLNLPGKFAWITMEIPGFVTVLYCMITIPRHLNLHDLPQENKIMAALFVVHYIYRAIIGPLLNPSMSPIHFKVWLSAIIFQILNGISIGGYLGGYGPTIHEEWLSSNHPSWSLIRFQIGMVIWAIGFIGNIYHDDLLRDIRRISKEDAVQAGNQSNKAKGVVRVEKLYCIPKNGLFSWVLFPHYLCEWIEWAGWWMIGGSQCVPARIFLVNEIATMTPRAIQGRHWYMQRFGREKLVGVKAILPGIL